jgi:hypothetical protein
VQNENYTYTEKDNKNWAKWKVHLHRER